MLPVAPATHLPECWPIPTPLRTSGGVFHTPGKGAMSTWSYDYATVTRVVDGDTIRLNVDLGFGLTFTGSFRLLGCNAIELSMPGGKEARDNLAALLPAGTPVTLHSVKNDKYSRWDAAISTTTQGDISTALIRTGWAAPWDGTGKAPVPAWPRQGT